MSSDELEYLREIENECDGSSGLYAISPLAKKRCPDVDNTSPSLTSSSHPSVLSRLFRPHHSEEDTPAASLGMIPRRNRRVRKRDEDEDDEVIIVEESVSGVKTHSPTPTTNTPTRPDNNEGKVKERRECGRTTELVTKRSPLIHTLSNGSKNSASSSSPSSSIADFRFASSTTQSTRQADTDLAVKTKNKEPDWLKNSRNQKRLLSRRKPESFLRSHLGIIQDKYLGIRKRPSSILSSRIKHTMVQKSFLHEEKMRYQQLLQQYTDGSLQSSSRTSTDVYRLSRASSSPVGMVIRSKLTPQWTKHKKEQIENGSVNSSSKHLAMGTSSRCETLEELSASKVSTTRSYQHSKDGLSGNGSMGYQDENKAPSIPLIDISNSEHKSSSRHTAAVSELRKEHFASDINIHRSYSLHKKLLSLRRKEHNALEGQSLRFSNLHRGSLLSKKKEVDASEEGKIIRAYSRRRTPDIPVIDISCIEKDSNSKSNEESDTESVVVVDEVLSPMARKNSLDKKLKDHPVYDHKWVRSLKKEYESRAKSAALDAESTSKMIQELEEKRNRRLSLDDKVAQRLKLLDLTYTAKHPEIQALEEEEEEEEAFLPLTPDMEDEIDDALAGTPASEVLVEKFHIQITRRDIKTLDGLNWLNDEVINFYMNLIMERSQNHDNYPSVYAFNTFFYPKLSKSGYQSVRRWTKKVDIFRYDVLLVPIHLGMHWCLATMDFKMKYITYYDSMLGNNERCLKCMMKYLEEEHQDKKKKPYKISEWKLQNKKNIPQQMNGSDCGMFACKFAEYLSRRAKINFDQEHMPYFRRRMVYEIIKGRLL